MKKKNIVVVLLLSLVCLLFVGVLFSKKSYSKKNDSVDVITLNRINEIRRTKNTDVSKIKGNMYYLSNNGDDNNDGLSPDKAWKTLTKLNQMMSNKTVKNGDAVLFNRGDLFRGNIAVRDNNITFGSYGDVSKDKPKLYGSTYDAAKEGKWVEVYPNYWKYTIDGNDAIFSHDVGEIWLFCYGDNNNCDRTTTDGKIKYSISQKKMSYSNVEENENVIASLLRNDLDFYHVGHAYNASTTGKELYLYSTSNPQERFDEIEISLGTNAVGVSQYNDIVVDNLQFSFYGRHGVGAGSVSNLTVTNSEFSFIGGMVQYYNEEYYWPVRFGNAIEVYGSVAAKDGFPLKDGFVIKNNYIYEIYDAGMTFQYTAKEGKNGIIEKATFDNNVVEYCSYNIEYWMRTEEINDTSKVNNTYLNKIYFTNNIFRFAGMGFTETRPEHGYEALIKTWDGSGDSLNVLKDGGEFIIENNIFDTTGQLNDNKGNLVGTWMLHITSSNRDSLPIIRNNKFYNYYDRNLGYVTAKDLSRDLIPYNEQLKFNEGLLKDNEFIVYNQKEMQTGTKNGLSGDVVWSLNLDKRTLTISGIGKMQDYTEENPAPWNSYRDYISNIVIGEDVTYLGKRAFYDCGYVQNIYYNAKNLTNLVNNNDVFFAVGKKSTGVKLIIGENVSKIPAHLTNPHWTSNAAPYITSLEFKGNKVTDILDYGLSFIYADDLILPDTITTLGNGALSRNNSVKIVKIPARITNLNKDLLKGCKNLETVILGTDTISMSEGSLLELPSLSRIVVPNSKITIDKNVEVLNKLSPYGVQIYGLSLDGTIPNKYSSYVVGSSTVYSIPFDNYKPMIYGDSKNYYAIYDDYKYYDNVKYEAKALSNSKVNITDAKYRYIDRFGHKHLIDGVDINTSSNIINNLFMDIELVGNVSNKDERIIDDQNVLFLGNSFLMGFGTHGMASTNINDDYYYYVNQYLKSLNSNVSSYKVSVNPWEETTSTEARTKALNDIITKFNSSIKKSKKVGTVFIQLAENINSDERRTTFESDLDALIKRFKTEYPDAKIYLLLGDGNSKVNKDIVNSVCFKNSIEVIPFISLQSRYRSYLGDKYYNWSNATSYVTNEGVAWHPNNYGFVNIADSVISSLKNNNYGRIPTITSDKYEIKDKTIYIKTYGNKILRTEFVNNIVATDRYKIYYNNKNIINDKYIYNGSIIKMLNVTYRIDIEDITPVEEPTEPEEPVQPKQPVQPSQPEELVQPKDDKQDGRENDTEEVNIIGSNTGSEDANTTGEKDNTKTNNNSTSSKNTNKNGNNKTTNNTINDKVNNNSNSNVSQPVVSVNSNKEEVKDYKENNYLYPIILVAGVILLGSIILIQRNRKLR